MGQSSWTRSLGAQGGLTALLFMPFISIPPPLSSGLWWVGRGKGFAAPVSSLVYTPSLPSGSKDWLRICCPSLCLGKQLPDTVLQAEAPQAAGGPLRQQAGPSGSRGPLRAAGGPSGGGEPSGGGGLSTAGGPLRQQAGPSGSRGAPQAFGGGPQGVSPQVAGAPQAEGEPSGSRGPPQAVGESLQAEALKILVGPPGSSESCKTPRPFQPTEGPSLDLT